MIKTLLKMWPLQNCRRITGRSNRRRNYRNITNRQTKEASEKRRGEVLKEPTVKVSEQEVVEVRRK